MVKSDAVIYQGVETRVENVRQAVILGEYVVLLDENIRVYADNCGKLEEACTYSSVEQIYYMQALEMRGIASVVFVTQNELHFLTLSNDKGKVTLKSTGGLRLHKHVTQFVCYQENDHLNLFSAVGNEIYYSEIKETDLEVNRYVLLLSRNQPCALMRYNNDVFVQSEKSVYKVIFLGENIHILPIMTQPSANIRASLPILDI